MEASGIVPAANGRGNPIFHTGRPVV